ncbi:MAG: non-canonical purine NTP pyrophosphatase, partial [Acidimicrobiales bacterium]|nr:non-canonical purine NTP pyrophosphatase [Acidimicrobiales bacterium]
MDAGERVVLASANPKKAAEIAHILGDRIALVPRPTDVPDVVEDADTFVGNARLKASALVAATGLAALADDSGLEVEALDGAPGVHSARYAGEGGDDGRNVAKLLAALSGLPGSGLPGS